MLSFSSDPLTEALHERQRQLEKLLALDDLVVRAVAALKAQGLESPFLKPFVVARLNPLRFKRGGTGEFDPVLDKMIASAEKF